MDFSIKYLILFLFFSLINKCMAEDEVTEIKEEPPAEPTSPSDNTPKLDPNLDTTPEKIGDTTPGTPTNSFEAITDCDNLKLVLADYSSQNSSISWGDHTMDCCDGEKYVCQDIEGQRYITEINLSYNYLSGSISSHIANFTNLEKLDLHNNRLTGNLPDDFRYLKNLKILNLNSNQLSGEFPVFIGELSSLQEIDVSNNGISGHLPESLNDLYYLEKLSANYNLISGGITDFFSNTPNLTILNLSLNKLEGKIPKSIYELYNLTELYLNDNNLKGSLPDSFVNLENLEIINLSKNEGLDGRVPDMPKYLKSCNYEKTNLCVKENAICGLDQIPICKTNTTKVIIIVVGCIVAVIFVGLIIKKLISKAIRRNKHKQSDQELLVGDEAMDDNDNVEEGEFIQMKENDDDNRHYVEVDEDYIFNPKNMNKFIN